MSDRKDFGDGIIFTISNYFWWFLMANIYFLLVNIPFIFIWLISTQAKTSGINLFLIITAIPIGPALTALFSVMGKLIREKDLDVTKDFFRAYKKNFLEAIFFSSIIIVTLSVIYIDITFTKISPIINIMLLTLGFIIISLTFYIFPIVSRFYLRKSDVIKLAFAYSIRKFHITISNWAIFIGIFMALSKIPLIMLLFMWSIYGYLTMLLQSGIIKELEGKITNQNEI